MRWFKSSDSLDKKTVSKWIWSIRNGADVNAMHDMRKRVQRVMFDQISSYVLPIETELDANAAYLLIHFFSGRAKLASFGPILEAKPEATALATKVFATYTSNHPDSNEFEFAAIHNCCIEVANEAVEGHYVQALTLAQHGTTHWPECGELWRQRGVLRLTQGDYSRAQDDLLTAQSLKPDMIWLREPLRFAEERVG